MCFSKSACSALTYIAWCSLTSCFVGCLIVGNSSGLPTTVTRSTLLRGMKKHHGLPTKSAAGTLNAFSLSRKWRKYGSASNVSSSPNVYTG